MKLNSKATAHTFGLLAAGYYLICAVLLVVAPDFFFGVYKSWFHGLDLTVIMAENPPDPGTIVLGLITFTALSWVTGYLGASVYNYFVKSK